MGVLTKVNVAEEGPQILFSFVGAQLGLQLAGRAGGDRRNVTLGNGSHFK